MKKKLIALNTTIMLGLGSVFSIPAVQAETSIESQRTAVQSEIEQAKQLIQDLQADKATLEKKVEQINEAIKENTAKINETKEKIEETQAAIDALQKEIAALEDRIAQRQEVLKERALSFQQSGGNVDLVEVVFGSTSFSDFISRVGAVATIVEADQEILNQQQADKKELEEKKSTVKDKLSKLESEKVELLGMQTQIEEQKVQSEKAIAAVEAKATQTAALQKSLEEKDAKLAAAQVAAIQAEKEKAAQEQAARQKTLSEAAKQAENSTSNTIVSSNDTTNDTTNNTTNDTANDTTDEKTSETTNSSSSVAAVAKPSSGNISAAITAGYKYIGNSTYKFGGGRTASDIANGLFDCSAFVAWAFGQAGISLPAHTDSLKHAGTQVSTSQMQPGDLVFFNTYKTDGHVGIYLGGGKFIGSQSSTGVAIANMSSGYWAQKFNGRVVRVN